MNPALGQIVPSVSTALGKSWASDVASELRAQTREVVGGWPGTLREARMRVLRELPVAHKPALDPAVLAAWSRAVYDAARRHWDQIAEPDLEP